GRLELSCEMLDAKELVQFTLDEFEAMLRDKELVLQFDAQTPAWIWGDWERLAQVVRNVVGNAIKFTPNGGALQIALVAAEPDIELTFQDTGPGIADNECERVFDKFVQAKGASKAGGTGLGLAIC